MNNEMKKGIVEARALIKERRMKFLRAEFGRVFLKRAAIVFAIAWVTVLGAWIHLSGMNILEFLHSIELL